VRIRFSLIEAQEHRNLCIQVGVLKLNMEKVAPGKRRRYLLDMLAVRPYDLVSVPICKNLATIGNIWAILNVF
jgi:hypothetical protein